MPALTLSKPVIAAVNGHALGLGLTLALQCDIRLFAADAQYGIVQVRRGVVGDAYSHWILPRLVGISKAAEILLTGATFDGHRAVRLGLGSRVLDADEVLPAALRLAHDIAENTAPASVAASKRLLWDSFELDRAGRRRPRDRDPSAADAARRRQRGRPRLSRATRPGVDRQPGRPHRRSGYPPGAEPVTSTPAARRSSIALAVDSGATPAVRSSRTRVAKPASAASAAVACTQ